MSRLSSWSEQEAVESLVAGLVSVAGLIAHRPDTLNPVLAAAIDQLGDDERKLIVALNWEMVRRNVAEMHAEEREQEAALEASEDQERSEENESPSCARCGNVRAAVCCSSHGKRLCHLCYRRTHFVEVCAAGCSECAAAGLPVKLSDLEARRG